MDILILDGHLVLAIFTAKVLHSMKDGVLVNSETNLVAGPVVIPSPFLNRNQSAKPATALERSDSWILCERQRTCGHISEVFDHCNYFFHCKYVAINYNRSELLQGHQRKAYRIQNFLSNNFPLFLLYISQKFSMAFFTTFERFQVYQILEIVSTLHKH